MKSPIIWVSIFLAALLTGCAHPIDVTPDTTTLSTDANGISNPKIPAKVGYFIAPDLTALEVTTPGGGGDNVRYFPYKAIEPGFQKILTNVFGSAIKLDTAPTAEELARRGINYLVVPTVVTTSGSTGFFTWPPTNFSVDLSNQIRSQDGIVIATPRVVGVGSAGTSERLGNHGMAGQRAMADALIKMQTALLEAKLTPSVQPPSIQPPTSVQHTKAATSTAKDEKTVGSIEERLSRLKTLFDQKLLTKDEYDKKRRALIEEL